MLIFLKVQTLYYESTAPASHYNTTQLIRQIY